MFQSSVIFSIICTCITQVVRSNPTGNNYKICFNETTIIDPERSSHNIPFLIYYPCDRSNKYPFMIFGHAAESQDTWYDYIWQGMVPQGYITIFLGTYEYVSNSKDFAKDQRFTNDWVRDTCSNDPNCPLYNIVMGKSIVSGMSMGGGAAMLAAGENSLGENFNHTFDALMTLSGCGNVEKALKSDKIPSLIMSGSHDCICPAVDDADKYYEYIPETTCKYLAVIQNGTHCHFGQEGLVKDDACEETEKSGCHGIPYTNNIPETTQHNIVVSYFTSFMFATLYDDDNSKAMNNVTTQLTNDKNSGVMYNIAINCTY